MYLLITLSCLVSEHECTVQKQLMPDQAACTATAQRKQDDFNLIEGSAGRYLIICREVK